MRTYEIVDFDNKTHEISCANLRELEDICRRRNITIKKLTHLSKKERARRRAAWACDPKSDTYWSS